VLVNLTKYNKEDNYIETNLNYIRIYFKQVKELNLIAKRKLSIAINLIAKTKTLTIINLITKTKIAINLLTIANKY